VERIANDVAIILRLVSGLATTIASGFQMVDHRIVDLEATLTARADARHRELLEAIERLSSPKLH
jgi:hypothetical protein